jgi:hypothetical protein
VGQTRAEATDDPGRHRGGNTSGQRCAAAQTQGPARDRGEATGGDRR